MAVRRGSIIMKPTDSRDKGTLHALLVHSSTNHLPRILQTQQKVTCGCQLSNSDIRFMQEVCTLTASMKTLMQDYPDYHEFIARYISLIREITGLALSNEMAKVTSSNVGLDQQSIEELITA